MKCLIEYSSQALRRGYYMKLEKLQWFPPLSSKYEQSSAIYNLYYAGQYFFLRDTILNYFQYLNNVNTISNQSEQVSVLTDKYEELYPFLIREREGIRKIELFVRFMEPSITTDMESFEEIIYQLIHLYAIAIKHGNFSGIEEIQNQAIHVFQHYDEKVYGQIAPIQRADDTLQSFKKNGQSLTKVVR